jgi:hypothetical protein
MPVRSLEERFAAMDADGDGAVSREEFFAAHPGMKDEAFAAIDGDGDGVIMLREWKDFAAGHGRAGAMPPMPPMPGGAPRDGTGMPPADPGRPPALLMPPDAPR